MRATNDDDSGSPVPRRERSAQGGGAVRPIEANRPGVDLDLLPELLGYQLRRAQVAVFQDFMQTMGALNMSPGQFGVLAVVGANDGLSQSAVAQALGTERSTMVALVDRLERDGLLLRRLHATDRRTYALSLTSKGRTALSHLKGLVRQHEARIAAALSPAEQATLLDLLGKLTPKK